MKKRLITCENFESSTCRQTRIKLKLRDIIGGYPNPSYRNTLGDEGGSVSSLINIKQFFNGVEEAWLNGIRKLILHPDFQRSYVVGGDDQYEWRSALIETVVHGLVINPIYFGITELGKLFVVIDGQQRLITLCDFICGLSFYNFMYGGKERLNMNFSRLPEDIQERILNYEMDVVICIGREEALHEYFKTINQPTFVLNFMELLCSSYTNPMMESAKRDFVRLTSAASSSTGKRFLDKSSEYRILNYSSENGLEKSDKGEVRMEALRCVLKWAGRIEQTIDTNECTARKIPCEKIIEIFTENHKKDADDSVVRNYAIEIIDFIRKLFLNGKNGRIEWGVFKKFDAKVGWDLFWLKYKDIPFSVEDKDWITKEFWRIFSMVDNKSVHDQCYLFEYVVIKRLYGGDMAKKYLDEKEALVPFSMETRRAAYDSVNGIDITDGKHYEFNEMEFHHAKPRLCGGSSEIENCIPMAKHNHKEYHANGGVVNGIQFNTAILIEKINERRELVEKQRLKYGNE